MDNRITTQDIWTGAWAATALNVLWVHPLALVAWLALGIYDACKFMEGRFIWKDPGLTD